MADEDTIVRTSDNEIEELENKLDDMKFYTEKYCILMETDPEQFESWYCFLKYEGNEENLKNLKAQIDKIEMYVEDDYHTFDIDIENLVSATTAREMTKVELNSATFHRKFDGKLKNVNIKLKPGDSNKRMIRKINKVLGDGNIDRFIDDEDTTYNGGDGSSDSSSSSGDEEMSDEPEPEKKNNTTRKPPVFNKELPRFARRKQKRR